jgi:hypothetical protein
MINHTEEEDTNGCYLVEFISKPYTLQEAALSTEY